jgi:hypothetical protein
MPDLHLVGGNSEPARSVERFELVTRNGRRVGDVELRRPRWPLGTLIDHDARRLRVVEVMEPDSPGELRTLVIEPV